MNDLKLKSLAVTSYLIHDVTVNNNEKGPRFAIATVSLLNASKQPITDSIHQIELKHCYSRYSKGPKTTAFSKLTNQILIVKQIVKPSFSDLDIITWSLKPYQTNSISTEDQFIISREEDDQLIWDCQAEALLLESEVVEPPEEEDTDGYNPFDDEEPKISK